MNPQPRDEAYRVANMTANKQLQFEIWRSDPATEAMTWSFTDLERVSNQLEREIYAITLNEQKQFKKQFSIRLIMLEA